MATIIQLDEHRWSGPIGRGWDWDRRSRTPWFYFQSAPTRSGLYEVRGIGVETGLREYTVGRGWINYYPMPGDQWRGLRKGYFKRFKAPYREKKPPELTQAQGAQ